MTAQVVRRIGLPADHSSPGAARSAVRAVAVEAGLTDVLDEALLLTTELATNAVVHARTELEVDIVADADTLTVCVMDFRTGPLTMRHRSAGTAGKRRAGGAGGSVEVDERGRGLLLVDKLASSWGTVHHPGGKGVWFRLTRPGATVAAPAVPGLDMTAAGSSETTVLSPETLA